MSPRDLHHGTRVTPFLRKATAVACLGGVLFGYDLGVVSGALPSLNASLGLTSTQSESVVSFLYLGSIIGALVGGYVCDRFGRRTAILYTDFAFLVGAIILASAPTYEVVLTGRVVVGVAVAISALADVSYLTEISPECHRGALVSCNEACISLGFLLSYVSSYAVTVNVGHGEGWRVMFGLSGLIAVLQWCLMLKMPESPVWLDENGREEEAQEALRLITDGERVPSDLDLNEGDQEGEENPEDEPLELQDRPKDGAASPGLPHEHPSAVHYWRQGVIAAFLAVSQQFCGNVNILNFAPEIFAQLFYGTSTADNSEALMVTTVILGTVKFLITSLVIWEVDTLGRRYLLLGGVGLITFSLLLLIIAFSTGLETEFLDSSTGNVDARYSTAQQAMALVGCTGVVAGYALSYGPLTWLITSEVFPSTIRGRAIGSMTVLTHASAALISYTFLTGQDALGPAAPFALYFSCSFLSLCFAYLAVPDTGGVRAEGDGEDVDDLLDNMWFWRQQCCFCCWWCCPGGGGGSSRREKVEKVDSLRDVDDAFDQVDEDLPTPNVSLTPIT